MCCGRNRRALRSFGAAPSHAGSGQSYGRLTAGVTFQYLGSSALTVVGPATGVSYRFSQPGSQVLVDPRDRHGLDRVPVLRLIT
jgi:hypothetical protein